MSAKHSLRSEQSLVKLSCHLIEPQAGMPNNPHTPLLVYAQALDGSGNIAFQFKDLFHAHDWPSAWRGGIFDFHHYHSSAHEVLGIYRGEITLCFGGDSGLILAAKRGDVIVVPDGVAHKRLYESGNLGIVGGYPRGQIPDTCDGSTAQSDQVTIASVSNTVMDPVYGAAGFLQQHWPLH